MAFNKRNWKNYPDKSTPIDAENLNRIEKGVGDAHDMVSELNVTVANKANMEEVADLTYRVDDAEEEIAKKGDLASQKAIEKRVGDMSSEMLVNFERVDDSIKTKMDKSVFNNMTDEEIKKAMLDSLAFANQKDTHRVDSLIPGGIEIFESVGGSSITRILRPNGMYSVGASGGTSQDQLGYKITIPGLKGKAITVSAYVDNAGSVPVIMREKSTGGTELAQPQSGSFLKFTGVANSDELYVTFGSLGPLGEDEELDFTVSRPYVVYGDVSAPIFSPEDLFTYFFELRESLIGGGGSGTPGPQGPKGDTGPEGPQGPKGDKGDTTVGVETKGMYYFNVVDGNLVIMYDDNTEEPSFFIDDEGNLKYKIKNTK